MALRLKRLEDLSPITSATSEKGLYSASKHMNGISVSKNQCLITADSCNRATLIMF